MPGGWNDGGGRGHLQIISLTDNATGVAGPEVEIGGTLTDQGLSVDVDRRVVYAALDDDGAAVVSLPFEIVIGKAESQPGSILSVAAIDDTGTFLAAGTEPAVSIRCP